MIILHGMAVAVLCLVVASIGDFETRWFAIVALVIASTLTYPLVSP
jgi:hypothetical protein